MKLELNIARIYAQGMNHDLANRVCVSGVLEGSRPKVNVATAHGLVRVPTELVGTMSGTDIALYCALPKWLVAAGLMARSYWRDTEV